MQRRFQYDLMLMMVAMFLPVLAQVLPIPPKSYFICFTGKACTRLYQPC